MLTDVSTILSPPLMIGGQQRVIAHYDIGPSGSTTFVQGQEHQMETDLENAQWNIQVIVDGRNAAQQSASGSPAFVNGALLSYSTNYDISLEVTIDGVIPQTQSNQVMVLQVKEIDNSGHVVPGSVIMLTQPLAARPAPTVQTVLSTPAPTIIPPSPTKSAGFPVIWGILAISIVVIILFGKDK